MNKVKFKILLKAPKIRKPIAKKVNSFMKNKKQYTRKNKHKKFCE